MLKSRSNLQERYRKKEDKSTKEAKQGAFLQRALKQNEPTYRRRS